MMTKNQRYQVPKKKMKKYLYKLWMIENIVHTGSKSTFLFKNTFFELKSDFGPLCQRGDNVQCT